MSSTPPVATSSTAEVLRRWGIPHGSNAAALASILRRFEEWCLGKLYPCPGTIAVIEEFLSEMEGLAGTTLHTYRRTLFKAHGFPMPNAGRQGTPQMSFFIVGLPEPVRMLAEQEAERLLSGKD